MRAFNLITLSIFWLMFASVSAHSQLRQVEKFRFKDSQVKVYFKDPLKSLEQAYANFNAIPDDKKVQLYDSCLSHSDLYTFVVSGPGGQVISYVVRGNPVKQNSSMRYDLAIIPGGADIDPLLPPTAVVSKFGMNGEVFEHMELLRQPAYQNREAILIWGSISHVKPFREVKKIVTYFIDLDQGSGIPDELIANSGPQVAPLFGYQQYALDQVKSRTFAITVFAYDSTGKVIRANNREEKYDYLYETSTDANNIAAVTALPFFAITDSLIATQRADSFLVRTGQAYLQHYLKDIYLIRKNGSDEVSAVGGTLLIHGYGINGHSVHEEQYRADFAPVGTSLLPVRIGFYNRDDKFLQRPRVVTEVKYELK